MVSTDKLIICNLPIKFTDFKHDPSIHLYDLNENRFTMSTDCSDIFAAEEKDPLFFDLINQSSKF